MDYSEKLVVNGLKAGDTEAYQYIFDTHYQVLCYTANRYVRDSFVAETIVGDMIYRMWENELRSMSTLRCAATSFRLCATDVLTICAPSTNAMRWQLRILPKPTAWQILPMASSR